MCVELLSRKFLSMHTKGECQRSVARNVGKSGRPLEAKVRLALSKGNTIHSMLLGLFFSKDDNLVITCWCEKGGLPLAQSPLS